MLSKIYDKFNDNFNYEKYLNKVFKHFDLPDSGLALDCGCGTGSLLECLLQKGYDCTGVDSSQNMLCQAEEKLISKGYIPQLICQDITNLDLYGAYNIIFCTLDTVNHILYKKNISKFFDNLYNFTEPDGWLIFDIKNKKTFISACTDIIRESDDYLITVQGDYDGKYAEYYFNVFKKTDTDNYVRIQDTVQERMYSITEIKSMLNHAKFKYMGIIHLKDRDIIAAQKKL